VLCEADRRNPGALLLAGAPDPRRELEPKEEAAEHRKGAWGLRSRASIVSAVADATGGQAGPANWNPLPLSRARRNEGALRLEPKRSGQSVPLRGE